MATIAAVISSLKRTASDIEAEYGNDNGVLAKQEIKAAFDEDALTANERKALTHAAQDAGNTRDGLTIKGYKRALDTLKTEYRRLDKNHDGVLSGTELAGAKAGMRTVMAVLNEMVKESDAASSGNSTASDAQLRERFDELVLQMKGEIAPMAAPDELHDKIFAAFDEYDPEDEWGRAVLKDGKNYIAVVTYEDGFGHYTAFTADGREIKGDMEA